MPIKPKNNLQKKTIAVYGASSNIGSKFIQEAVTNGATVIAFTRDRNKILQKRQRNKKIKIIQGDITKLSDVRKTLSGKKVDVTINFAANFFSDIISTLVP